MVRAHVKQPAEEKKTVAKKPRATAKAKKLQSGVWPCKINGCNKEFAREADLKRHQRTTKLHMLPTSQPVLCPQCDATFTRTDALRRHQKSRHNGIIIDPVDPPNSNEAEGDGEGSSASAPRSRSGSPSTKDRNNGASSSTNASSSAPVQTVMPRMNASGPSSGSQSYYRQNTINPVFVPPRTPNGVLDPSTYQPTQIPTSAARFHTWIPNPPWIQETPNMPRPHPGPITFVHPPPPGYYAPGAYYRTPDGQPALPMHHLPHGLVTMQVNPNPPQPPAVNTESADKPSDEPPPEPDSNIDPSLGDASSTARESDEKTQEIDKVSKTDTFADAGLSAEVQKALQAVLAIDPSLNGAAATTTPQVTQAGSEKQESVASASEGSASATASETTAAADQQALGPVPPITGTDGFDNKDAGMDIDADGEADPDGETSYQEGQAENSSVDGESALPAGIQELINEDSLSYAAPS